MRAIAVTAVVAFHAFPTISPRGFLGVDIFFVISGFLITGIIWDELSRREFTVARFYVRRIKRIVPALAVVLAATFILGWLLMLPLDFQQLGKHMIGGALFFSNIQFWLEAGYFDKASGLKPLLHLWSLSVAEQFYLAWPWLLVWASARRVNPLWIASCIAVLSFCSQVVLARWDPSAAFYLPFTRLWELMLGAIVTLAHAQFPNAVALADRMTGFRIYGPIACIGMIILSASVGASNGIISTWWALLPTGATASLIILGMHNKFLRSLLAGRWMVRLGKISYPLYLWHWPLLVFSTIFFGEELSVWYRLLIVLISIALAWLTYVGVERPIRFGDNRAFSWPVLCTSLIALSMVGLLDFCCVGFPGRIPEPLRDYVMVKYDWAAGARVSKCWLPAGASYDGFDPICFTPHPGRRTAMVWGDSHAGRLYVGLQEVYGDDVDFEQLTRDSCPPILDFRGSYDICIKSNEYVFSLIEKNPPDLLIMFAVWHRYASDFHGSEIGLSLKATLERLRTAGVRHILIIGPAPEWTDALPNLLARFWRADFPYHQVPAVMKSGLSPLPFKVDDQLKLLTSQEHAEYVSLVDKLCGRDGCLTRTTDGPQGLITADYGHLTAAGADYVARAMPIREILDHDQASGR